MSAVTFAKAGGGSASQRPSYKCAAVWGTHAAEVALLEAYVRLLLLLESTGCSAVVLQHGHQVLGGLSVVIPQQDCSPGALLLLAETLACQHLAGAAAPIGSSSGAEAAGQPGSGGCLAPRPYLHGYMSLLVSALKLAQLVGSRQGLCFCVAAAAASAAMLGATAAASGGRGSRAGRQLPAAAGAVAALPWAVLLGRCCSKAAANLVLVVEQSELVAVGCEAGITGPVGKELPLQGLLCMLWLPLDQHSDEVRLLLG